MPRKKGEWEISYYLGVDGAMHQSHHRKIRQKKKDDVKMKIPEHIKEICRNCPDIDCPFDICYYPHKEKGI